VSHPSDVGRARRVYIIFFVSFFVITTLLPFGVIALIKKNYTLATFDFALAFILAVNLLHARRYKRYDSNIRFGIIFSAVLLVYAFLTGGINGTGFVCYYTFPLIACFYLGSKKGAIATILISLPVVVLFLLKTPPSIFANYNFDFKLRFIFSFLVVSVFSYLFEYAREKNQEELQSAQDDLEKQVDERTSALQEAIQSLQMEISERRRIEGALRESEEKFRDLFENANDLIQSVRPDGYFSYVNRTWKETLRYREEEIPDLTIFKIIHPDAIEHCENIFRRVLSGEKVDRFETVFVAKDGTPVGVEGSTSCRFLNGEPLFVRGIFRNITERKRTEEALQEKTEELARSNRELEQFAYVASHDLQEPLRMVTSYVQLLAQRYKGKLDSDADDFIDFAVGGAFRMWTLINDLLIYSRVGMRGMELKPSDCETVFNHSLDNLKVAIEETGAVVTHDLLPTVMADRLQLEQLFQNLIGNAIKFRGNDQPRVHVSASRNGNGWTFSVCDNGIGIAPEYAKRIFIVFQRLHSREEYPGTGIGLAICQKIVERHGGHIWIESEPGRGATFFFTLPTVKAEPVCYDV
jgi:PAS domain S-box-containing protein